MHRDAKRLLRQSLIDLVLILAVFRQTEVDVLHGTQVQDEIHHDTFYDDGPLLGVTSSPVHHFQQQPSWGGPGLFLKSVDTQYDSVLDEYDNIMRSIRLRPPAIFNQQNSQIGSGDSNEFGREGVRRNAGNNRGVITMVLSIPNEASSFQNEGGVQVGARNFQPEGAVGGIGIGLPFSADDNFDIFSGYVPENMQDDDIENLMLSGGESNPSTAANRSLPDGNWQQFLVDHDNSLNSYWGSIKATNIGFGNWGNIDILNEAVQSAELFLPVADNSQNTSVMDAVVSTNATDSDTDLITASRLEMIETSEWASQNHEEDLLFPSLPPPSYEEVIATTNSTTESTTLQQISSDHMHDHNYFNASSSIAPSSSDNVTPNAGYAIRSRLEVSTRIITIPPRPRHVSNASSETSDTIDLTANLEGISRSNVPQITTSSDGSVEDMQEQQSPSGYELNSFEVKPIDSSYFENLRKDVGLRREIILCN